MAAEWREKLVQLAIKQDEEVLISYLKVKMPNIPTLKRLICKDTLVLEFAPVLIGTVF